ncbi:hypothetical protein SPSE_2275 [Staphylococcus pseudintermedius ED99]|nr:hypothetical protein SPSE_2275 [Staphylococcus pseudintermedius ED99]
MMAESLFCCAFSNHFSWATDSIVKEAFSFFIMNISDF